MPTSVFGQPNCEVKPRIQTLPTNVAVTVSGTTCKKASVASWCKLSVPKGLLPTLLYSLFFLAFPLCVDYTDIVEVSGGEPLVKDTEWKVAVIAASFVAALLVLLANDCVAWFNMILFFHLGVEITVLDSLVQYADDNDGSEMTLAWIAAAVILLHLVPFFTVDHAGLLTLLAFVGIVVNTAALVFVSPGMLLLTGFSSTMLLMGVLLIACIDCVKTSMLSQLRLAFKEGTWLMCSTYEK